MELVLKYFPKLSHEQIEQFMAMQSLYNTWNSRINVISRKDMENFYERHVLHSLSIAKVIRFETGTHIADIGTGGGFPGIPLAIMFPGCHFTLVDSIGKKIRVVNEVIQALGLENVETLNCRAEDIRSKFHFLVSRAVTTMYEFVRITRTIIDHQSFNTLENGILYLKGGDLDEELAPLTLRYRIFELKRYFDEPFFETKKLVHLYK